MEKKIEEIETKVEELIAKVNYIEARNRESFQCLCKDSERLIKKHNISNVSIISLALCVLIDVLSRLF